MFVTNIFLETGDRQGSGRLDNRTGRLIDLLDGTANFIRIDENNLIHIFFTYLKCSEPDIAYRYAVGKNSDGLQAHRMTGRKRTGHRITIHRFNTNHLDLRIKSLEINGNSG